MTDDDGFCTGLSSPPFPGHPICGFSVTFLFGSVQLYICALVVGGTGPGPGPKTAQRRATKGGPRAMFARRSGPRSGCSYYRRSKRCSALGDGPVGSCAVRLPEESAVRRSRGRTDTGRDDGVRGPAARHQRRRPLEAADGPAAAGGDRVRVRRGRRPTSRAATWSSPAPARPPRWPRGWRRRSRPQVGRRRGSRVRTRDELAAVVAANPYLDRSTDAKQLHVAFLVEGAEPARRSTSSISTGSRPRSSPWSAARPTCSCRTGSAAASWPRRWSRPKSTDATVRNWRTVDEAARTCADAATGAGTPARDPGQARCT